MVEKVVSCIAEGESEVIRMEKYFGQVLDKPQVSRVVPIKEIFGINDKTHKSVTYFVNWPFEVDLN